MAEHVAREFRREGLWQTKPAAAMPSSGWLEALDLMLPLERTRCFQSIFTAEQKG